MKKLDYMYLGLAIIAAEFVIIFPVLFPKHQDPSLAAADVPVATQFVPSIATHAPIIRHSAPAAETAVPALGAKPHLMAPLPPQLSAPLTKPVVKQSRAQSKVAVDHLPAPRLNAAVHAPVHLPQRVVKQPRTLVKVAVVHSPTPRVRAFVHNQVRVVAAPRDSTRPQQIALRQQSPPTMRPQNIMRTRPMPAAPTKPPVTQTLEASIFQFDATATHLHRGQKTFLCVGLASGVTATIRGVGYVAAGLTSCHRVAPQKTTTYVLRVRRDGMSTERVVKVNVKQTGGAPKKAASGSRIHRHRFDVPG